MLTLRKSTQFASVSFLILVTISCAQNQKATTETNTGETVVSSTPPFQTKEPERYRATRTITTVDANGETIVTKNLIAHDGERRRDEPLTEPQRTVYLYLPEGKFLLLPDLRAFVELTNVDQTQASPNDDESDTSPDRLLHTEPLVTSYQRLGPETINGRSTQKYRAVVNSSGDTNVSGSETVIWFDETLHMPIKSETKADGGKRVTMELSDISLDVDRVGFQVPEGYQKITLSDVSKSEKKSSDFRGKP
jgi:outer membrane lipoprotein-sorting protein